MEKNRKVKLNRPCDKWCARKGRGKVTTYQSYQSTPSQIGQMDRSCDA